MLKIVPEGRGWGDWIKKVKGLAKERTFIAHGQTMVKAMRRGGRVGGGGQRGWKWRTSTIVSTLKKINKKANKNLSTTIRRNRLLIQNKSTSFVHKKHNMVIIKSLSLGAQ